MREIWLSIQKKQGRLGSLTLSVNPFIPKPFTPFQWEGMDGEKSLTAKLRRLRAGVARLANTSLICESVRGAVLQAFLSRGDRRVGATLPLLAAGDNLATACRKIGLDPAFYVTRQRREDEVFPWEVLNSGVSRAYLWRECLFSRRGQLTPRCLPGCRRCGVCG